MTIPVTTRAGKGSALTPGEMDTNLTNLGRDSTQGVQGNIRLATPSEAAAGADLTTAITPGTLGSGINGYYDVLASFGGINNSANGWIVLPKGIVIMWGQIARTGAQTTPVNFPYTSCTNVWSIVCNDEINNNSYVPRALINSPTQFTITPTYFGGANDPICITTWIAIGSNV